MVSRRVFLSGLVLAVPAAHAQRWGRDRYEITVFNNWDRPVEITIAAEKRDEVVRDRWTIPPRQTTILVNAEQRRIRVRGTDRIKVSRDMRAVRIGDVARWDNGAWHLSIRDVIRAQREKERDRDPDRRP